MRRSVRNTFWMGLGLLAMPPLLLALAQQPPPRVAPEPPGVGEEIAGEGQREEAVPESARGLGGPLQPPVSAQPDIIERSERGDVDVVTEPPSRAGGQAPRPLTGEALRRELVALRERVAELEEQVEVLRGAGVGGAGGEGVGLRERNAEEPDVRLQGPIAVATAAFDGTVRSVSPERIHVLDESGNLYDLFINPRTRVFADGERIRPEELPEGTPVRASLALIQGVNHARDIVVLDEDEPLDRAEQEQLEETVPPLP